MNDSIDEAKNMKCSVVWTYSSWISKSMRSYCRTSIHFSYNWPWIRERISLRQDETTFFVNSVTAYQGSLRTSTEPMTVLEQK